MSKATVRRAKAYRDSIKERVGTVRRRIDSDDESVLDALKRIERMADSLPTDSQLHDDDVPGEEAATRPESPAAARAITFVEEIAEFDDSDDFDHDTLRRARAIAAEL